MSIFIALVFNRPITLNEYDTLATNTFFTRAIRKRSLIVNAGLQVATAFFVPELAHIPFKVMQSALSINSIFHASLNGVQKITDGLQAGSALAHLALLMVMKVQDETCSAEPPSGNLCASIFTLNLIYSGILTASIVMDYMSQSPDSQQTPLARARA